MFGVYDIQETVGHGGMGVVYRAHDTALDRVVALKVLKEDLRSNKQVAARFQREAQAIASLSHPGIVHIFAVGSVGRIPFISMEFIEGQTLSQLMKREKRVPWKRALYIAEQVAEALACAHDAHIIHRDVKPGNVLLGPDDRAYVTDFGIAKVLTAETQLTVEGSRLGTPNYMSPERCMNREITPASDIYSLGVLLFQMITGRLPYESSSPVELIKKIVSDPPSRVSDYVPDIPADVERLIAHLIEKKPSERPNDASDVARMCRRVIEGEPLFEESAVAASIRDFRDVNETPSTGTTGLSSDMPRSAAPVEAIAGAWRRASDAARVWAVGIVVIATFAGLGQVAVKRLTEGLARRTVAQWDRSISGWLQSPSAGEFARDSENVMVVRINLPRMSTSDILPVGMSDFVIELSGAASGRGAGLWAVALLAPDPGSPQVRLGIPPSPGSDGERLARLVAGEIGASPAFPTTEAVLIADRVSGIGGIPVPTVLRLDATLGDKDYGRKLLDANDFTERGGSTIREIPIAAVSPWKNELAVAVGDGTADGWQIYTATLERGTIAGAPVSRGPTRSQPLQLSYARDGAIYAAQQRAGGGLSIVRLPEGGGEEIVFESEDSTATIADLTSSSAAVLTGSASERRLTWVDFSGGGTVDMGAAQSAVIHPDGERVIVTKPDHRGELQIWTADVNSPDTMRQLTFLAGGVGRHSAVSRDGKYVLSNTEDDNTPRLVLVSLDAAPPPIE